MKDAGGGVRPARGGPVLSSNLGWMSGFLLLVLVGLKVLMVSHFNLTTALGLVSAGSVGSVVVGALIGNLANFVLLLGAMTLVGFVFATSGSGEKFLLGSLATFFGLASFLTTFWPAALLGVIGMVVVVVRWRPKTLGLRQSLALGADIGAIEARILEEIGPYLLLAPPDLQNAFVRELANARASLEEGRNLLRRRLFAAALFLVILTVGGSMSDRPWIAPERVTLAAGPTFVGYFVREGNEVVILRGVERSLVRVPSSAIARRSYCSGRLPFWAQSLLELTYRDKAGYPPCS